MENNNDNIVMSRIAFERMQAKDERNDRWRKDVWNILNDVMEMLRATQPNVYIAIIRKLNRLQ